MNKKIKEGMKNLKNHRKKEKKNHIFVKIFAEIALIFAISTMSIVLYDMYINIDVYEDMYNAEKISQEVNTIDTKDISSMLEQVSKSVVRNL